MKFQSTNLIALDTQTVERLENPEYPKLEPHQVRTFKVQVPMIVEAKAFMKATKYGAVFAIYATLVTNSVQATFELPTQYKDYVFEEKNADMLPQYRPYDCGIHLQEGIQPPFAPIYNL